MVSLDHQPAFLRPPPDGSGVFPDLLNAPARLAAVRHSGLLDAPMEEAFDSVTRLAARLTGVPATFVSIVDAERDFYLSQQGFPAEIAECRQLTGRTFCHYTLDSDAPLVIGDTHSDPVWAAVGTVKSLGVRAYVGVPLKVDGQRIGSFCVVDTQPREWLAADVETLRQLASSVEREIQLRLAVAKARAEAGYSLKMARSREAMAAAVAHDLRTPLQILQLGMTVLKRIGGDREATVFKRMTGAVESMKGMADALLRDSAALPEDDSVKRQLTAFELAADATGMMTAIADSAGIRLTLGEVPDVQVLVEYAQMLRALGNLIGNGIKYSPVGSCITVNGRLVDGGKNIRLEVHDQGRGMSPADLERAFERGFQGPDGMVRGDGAGLGLGIVQHLVSVNGGSVHLESVLGRGTVAAISLPVAAA